MNTGEREVFCMAATVGLTLGLSHRYEWYTNAVRMLAAGDYPDIPKERVKIDAAFLAFEKTLAGSEEETEEAKLLTMQDFHQRVNTFYDKGALEGISQEKLLHDYQFANHCLCLMILKQGGEVVIDKSYLEEQPRNIRLWSEELEEGGVKLSVRED